jgi:glycosyltransferase involved in cell wall biosynthesis
MKIVILSTFDNFGGASIAASRLNKALNTNGLSSNMLVQDKKGDLPNIETIAQNWFQKKLTLLRFALDRLQFTFYEKNKDVRFLFSQATIGVDVSDNPLIQQSDIIHLHWINFGFLSINSLEKLFETGKPIVWTLHDMWAFTGGCHYARDCTNYERNCGNCEQFLKNPSENDLSHQVWERKKEVFSKANLTIVTCSEWLAQKARESSLLKDKTIISIPNPIDTEVFRPIEKSAARAYFELSPDKKYILFGAVKISDERKGFAYFVEALSILNVRLSNNEHRKSERGYRKEDIEIIIFGQAQASDFERLPFKVNILGKLSDLETIATAYSAATVFVSPSIEDNLPNTIMESTACGTPVVGFEIGGIPEMIDHKENGYLAKYKSAEDLAKGIYWILFESDYQVLVSNARQRVVDNYSEEIVAKRYQEVYRPSIAEGGVPEDRRRVLAPPSGVGRLLSIITITYNAEQFLERTIQSILAQTDQNFEYIIIDGKSKDKTLRIISTYKNRVNQLISEPDKGLYDAMNKGLKLANGDFVWFMNAGDEINDNQAVEKIYQAISDKTDVLYGDTYFVNNEGEIQGLRSEITPHRLPKVLKWQDMRLGMLVCHQAFIVRKSITPLYMGNNLSADVDWEIECLKRAKEVKYLDFVVAKYLTGGVSNQQLKRSLLDRYEVLKKHFGFIGAVIAHVQILWRGVFLMAKKGGKYW